MNGLPVGYHEVIIETYYGGRMGETHGVHFRPIAGQVFPSDLNVEYNRKVRDIYPVGTQFRIKAKITCKEGGEPFLYRHYSASYEIVPK